MEFAGTTSETNFFSIREMAQIFKYAINNFTFPEPMCINFFVFVYTCRIKSLVGLLSESNLETSRDNNETKIGDKPKPVFVVTWLVT